jgi:hypothetical protein
MSEMKVGDIVAVNFSNGNAPLNNVLFRVVAVEPNKDCASGVGVTVRAIRSQFDKLVFDRDWFYVVAKDQPTAVTALVRPYWKLRRLLAKGIRAVAASIDPSVR